MTLSKVSLLSSQPRKCVTRVLPRLTFVLGVRHKSGPIAQLAWLGKGPPLTLVPSLTPCPLFRGIRSWIVGICLVLLAAVPECCLETLAFVHPFDSDRKESRIRQVLRSFFPQYRLKLRSRHRVSPSEHMNDPINKNGACRYVCSIARICCA